VKKRVLTGITTTGAPHLGNYVGAIRPAIAASRRTDTESFYFLADLHALVKCQEPERVQRSTLEIAATWLALGLDPDRVYFYRQSEILEIPELTWLLTCVTGKGLLNRAHAYKAAVDQNTGAGEDPDAGITAGLYMYPVLMAADILVFNAHEVPVGRDQVQHLEIARDVAQRFNHVYGGEYFTLPEARVDESTAVLPGLDGRKMSKSYDNTIPLWLPADELRRAILGIVTNSQGPAEPKDPDDSHIFTIYQAFAAREETHAMREAFKRGIAWGEAKQRLYERIERELGPARERYEALMAEPERIEAVLKAGAQKARARSLPFLAELKRAVGLRPLARAAAAPAAPRKARAAGPRLLTYREKDGKFYFKLVDGDGETAFESRAHDTPDAARRDQDALLALDGEALRAAASTGEAQQGGFRFVVRKPGGSLLGMGPVKPNEWESRDAFEAFFSALAALAAARAADAAT
jgi:tryptophanyl-tRNA synthetase